MQAEDEAEPVRRRRRPRYNDEDISPTTEQELRGWYSYGVAAEVFAVSGTGSFLPVTLEQLARERGFLKSDGVTRCVHAAARSASLLLRYTARQDTTDAASNSDACVISVVGSEVNTSSFALYTISVAVAVQTLVLVSLSALADHGNYRKRFLLLLGWTGATACSLFIFVSPSLYLFAPILVIISVCCLGNSFALLNSFLPLLVANHPDRSSEQEQWQPVPTSDAQGSTDSKLRLANTISARGTGLGYSAAVLVQILAIAILLLISQLHLTDSTTLPLRSVLFLVGAWWALFTIPTWLYLRPRPGPRLPNIPITTPRALQPFYYITFSWRSLFSTLKHALRLPNLRLFLLAWFLMSDAIATVAGTAILFARTELHMDAPAIALVSITATAAGVAGATLWPKIQHRTQMPTNKAIIACLALFEIIPLYGLLGFILPVLGLRAQWEIFPLALVHGFVMGGLSSFCRSFYGTMVPPGMEAAFFALYAVTDKGASIIGPTIVGRIVDATGSVRMGFWFLAVLVVLPIPLVWFVDVQAGQAEARIPAGGGFGAAIDASDVGDDAIPLTERHRGRGGSFDEDEDDQAGDAVFGLVDSDDELDYLPQR